MQSFVDKKDKKSNQRCLWHGIDHYTGEVLAYVFGLRTDEMFLKLKKLLEPFEVTQFYTDGLKTYERHIDIIKVLSYLSVKNCLSTIRFLVVNG